MKFTRFRVLAALLAAVALPAGPLTAADATAKPREAPLVESLKDLKQLNRRLVAMAGPSVAATVSLRAKGGGGTGSGVVVSEDGLVLTAAHVIAAIGDEILVVFPDGTSRTAKALGADFDRDAAMAKINEAGSYPHVALGDSEALVRNDWCIALGHPGGYDPTRPPPVRLGRILRKSLFLVTDSAVVGGDSGGPLFDADGHLIGIHSNIGATLMENRHVPIGVYKEGWEPMLAGKRTGERFKRKANRIDPNRPVLGVQLGEPGKDGGVKVVQVMDDSPASKAGLQEGDLITAIEGKQVGNREQLVKAVGKFKAGRTITVAFRRDGEPGEAKVKLVRLRDLAGRASPQEEDTPDEKPDESGKDGAESSAPNEENEKDAALPDDKDLRKRLEDAVKSGRLKLTPQQLEEFGGLQRLQELLRELAEDIDPDARVRLQIPGATLDPFYTSSAKAITPVTRKAGDSTVAVFADGEQVALGTVVSPDGWVFTKDIETKKGTVTVELEGKQVPARLLKRFPKRDLALFAVEATALKPVRWRHDGKPVPVGSLLTSASSTGEPLGFGLLSVRTRKLSGIGFLGISAGAADQGVRIENLVNEGAAKKAGLRQGDVITAVDGEACSSPVDFGTRIRALEAGQTITLSVLRDEEQLEVKVTLGERRINNSTARFRAMNKMSGPLSKRTGGFPLAIQHDIPLDPGECGGPLLDLRGRCLGINVSRAGRVRTFAIPVSDLRELLAEVEPARAGTPKRQPGLTGEECREILGELEKLRQRIEALEKRIRQAQKQ